MSKSKTQGEKPLVGFFPLFYNLAETGRAVLVAKRYEALGGKATFFSHGGKYEYLAEKQGFTIMRVKPFYTEELIDEIVKINRGEKRGITYKEPFLRESVKEELAAYKKTGVKMIVSFVNISCSLSAHVAGIPLVCVSPAPGTFHLSIPDNVEKPLTLLIPQWIKLKFGNWFLLRGKKSLKPFNVIAKEYHLKPFSSSMEIFYGDVTLVTNFLEFINVFPNQQIFPTENYVGIISLEELFINQFSEAEKQKFERKITNHLKKTEKSILLTMGSSGDKNLFRNILRVLSKTNYTVIAVNANILKNHEIPSLPDNILLLDFVPSIAQLHKKVDLSIIHGGQGTVYTAAYAGKPIIGFPMQFEQHLNLEKMVGHGVGVIQSKRYYKDKKLLNAINQIFDNYNTYYKNAQNLAKKLPKPEGDGIAAQRIVEILQQNQQP